MKLAASWGKLLGAACALLLVCGHLLAQTHKAPSAAGRKATAKARAASSSKPRKGKKARRAANWRRRGQQKIDSQRAREIQEALIGKHYLDGNASGVWDDRSQRAMERFQEDNGWQTKIVPDSRALIKLGLGPNHEHLLNPESAMTNPPQTSRPAPAATSAVPPAATGPAPASQPQK